jgi:hypothetical protein
MAMFVDRYTKAVLTVIAVCLVWLAAGGPSLITSVSAQDNQRVILVGWVDQNGKVRQLSPGGAAGTDSLPVWIANR